MNRRKVTSACYLELCFSTISACVIAISPQKLWDNHCTWLFFFNLLTTPGCTMRQLQVQSY